MNGYELDMNDFRNITEKIIITNERRIRTISADYLQKYVDERDIGVQFDQPWYNNEVVIYKHNDITDGLEILLSYEIEGLTEGVTFRKVINTILDNGIPVFIVGGAVRVSV